MSTTEHKTPKTTGAEKRLLAALVLDYLETGARVVTCSGRAFTLALSLKAKGLLRVKHTGKGFVLAELSEHGWPIGRAAL